MATDDDDMPAVFADIDEALIRGALPEQEGEEQHDNNEGGYDDVEPMGQTQLFVTHSQIHLIGIWLIRISGSKEL